MERKAFTISRATWWRGQSAMGSRLLIRGTACGVPSEAVGKMCCLGSIALQCGFTEDQIANVPSPGALANIEGVVGEFAPLVDGKGKSNNSFLACLMMEANDSDRITEDEREARLTEIAATIGWDLTFTD